jgi:hypothetical protein
MGILGNNRDDDGNPQVVRIDEKQWGPLQKILRLQENEIDKQDGLVDAKVVVDELGICKKTLANMISSGKITREMYTVAPNGLKKFYIKKILGVEK